MNSEDTSLLIVDDDVSILKLLGNYIGRAFSFSTAASAEEAADVLSRESFKLVMTDIKMPGASGVDLCRSINILYPDTVVILMSGSAEVRDVIGAMKEGAYDCVLKPFDQVQVMVGIERALRHQTLLAAVNRLGPEYNGKTRTPFAFADHSSDSFGPMAEALRQSYHATVRSALGSLGARDPRAVSRSNRVAAACLKLGRSLNMSPADLIGLHQGALLHDIGRIREEDESVFKSGSLTQYEWTRASAHVVQGLRIIDGISFLSGARFVVGQHHERFDGSGYPVGLSGDSIHLHARIFGVADAFNTIICDQSHSGEEAYGAARDGIVAGSGYRFDPRVVKAFLGVSAEEWRQIHEAGEPTDCIDDSISEKAIMSFMVSLRSQSCAPEMAVVDKGYLCESSRV